MLLIGIAGGSGSGKTTFAKKIIHNACNATGFNKSQIALLHQDSYYLDEQPLHTRVNGEPNYDHPDAFDWTLLKDHLIELKKGGAVEVPIYDFKENRRKKHTLEQALTGPCQAVLVEGIYTLWDSSLRDLFDLKIFLNVDADIRFIRRLHRDVRERARTLDSIIRQYYDTVRPMHREFLEPTRQYADLVVGEETDIAAEVVGARIQQWLKQKK